MRSPTGIFSLRTIIRVAIGTGRFNSGLGLAPFTPAEVDFQRKPEINAKEERLLNHQKLKLALVLIGILCTAPLALADDHTMWLSSVSPGGNFLPGSVATGPYTANIDGVGGILVICNSFHATTYVGEAYQWTATATKVSDVASDPPSSSYAQVAYLARLLVAQDVSNPVQRATAALINYAIWDIFAPGAISNLTRLADRTDAGEFKAAALANAGSAAGYTDVTIWTPTSRQARIGNVPQEFITVRVPESGIIAMILFDLFAVGGLLLFVRRRRASALS
jgi:hypothetical protein